jgi:sulfur-carrier protein
MTYRLLYFASLADRAGCSAETLDSNAGDPGALYAEVAARHGFAMARERVRVAINGRFAAWEQALQPGDEIVFLPPVSGG